MILDDNDDGDAEISRPPSPDAPRAPPPPPATMDPPPKDDDDDASSGAAAKKETVRDDDGTATTASATSTATVTNGAESSPPPPPRSSPRLSYRQRRHLRNVAATKRHFERKGYRVHSGLQFGCELVLYADDPSRVHSDFCVHVPLAPGGDEEDGTDTRLDMRTLQTLVRSMPELRKTLIIARVNRRRRSKKGRGTKKEGTIDADNKGGGGEIGGDRGGSDVDMDESDDDYEVDELAISTEHAPFRHRAKDAHSAGVGSQVKPVRR